MIFSTYRFLIFFLIVFSGYFILNRCKLYTVSKIWLILASFYFYAAGSPDFAPWFIATVFLNYIFGTAMSKVKPGPRETLYRKLIFAAALTWNIGLLAYYKYTGFFIENLNHIPGINIPVVKFILPIGISFFTFQLIAYQVDSYRRLTGDYTILNYLLFITFFPQLIVGPIVHHSEVVPQFEDRENQKFNKDNVTLAAFIFIIGCSKKLLLADPLTEYAEQYFLHSGGSLLSTQVDTWTAWLSSLSYTISYYFDLSAYADMAIGLGLFFNIHLPQNFNSPYKALDFADYWRRWHITLSRFLNQYIFRGVFKKEKGAKSYYKAVMVTFLVSGFWHGAGWNFIIWGILNGIFVCIASYSSRKGYKMWKPLAWFITFMGVIAMRILFAAPTLTDAAGIFKNLFNFSMFSGMSLKAIFAQFGSYIVDNAKIMIVLVIGMAIAFFAPNTQKITENFSNNKLKYAIVAGFLFAICLVQMNVVARFLYFQF